MEALSCRTPALAMKELRVYRLAYNLVRSLVLRAARHAGLAPRQLSVNRRLRLKHYRLRTEQAYLCWIHRYVRDNGRGHLRDMGGVEVARFPSWLALHEWAAPAMQNRALSAVLFLYRQMLTQDLL